MSRLDKIATIMLVVILLICMAYACVQAWRTMAAVHAAMVTAIGGLGVFVWARFMWWTRQHFGGRK